MTEVWKPVVGWEGRYEVSDLGRVRSSKLVVLRLQLSFGYLCVNLRVGNHRDSRQKHHRVHRLVLGAFVGPCPDGMECRHLNGDRADNRLMNLSWGTSAENARDRVDHGTVYRPQGALNPAAKLTEADVVAIRAAHASGETATSISRRFAVDRRTVGNVARGDSWRHIHTLTAPGSTS